MNDQSYGGGRGDCFEMKCRLGNEKQPAAEYAKSVGEKSCKYGKLSLSRTT